MLKLVLIPNFNNKLESFNFGTKSTLEGHFRGFKYRLQIWNQRA